MSDITNQQIDQKLDLVLEHLRIHEKKFNEIDKQFEKIDHRFDQIDKQLEKIDHRFDQVDGQIKLLQEATTELKTTRFTWSVGVLALTSLTSTVLTMILLRLFSALGFKVVEVTTYLS